MLTKNLKIFIASIFFVLVFSSFNAVKEWYFFETNEYSLLFPEKPKASVQKIDTELGKLKMNLYMYEVSGKKDPNLLYSFITSEYPEGSISSSNTENLPAFFRGAIDGAVKNVQGKLLSEKEIKIKNYPGREIKIDYQNGVAIIKMRIYLINNVVAMVQTMTESSKDNNAEELKFHNSFKLK